MQLKFSVVILIMVLLLSFLPKLSIAQDKSTETFWNPYPKNYAVNQAFEVESLFPMFFYGGWHFCMGYRYEKFRLRISVINGGNYNADVQSVKGAIDGYERYYTTSPGIFFGYNVWKNLEVYGYYERHTFEIKQLVSNEKRDIPSNDIGLGISYQFFIGKTFYIQPGIHSYFRAEKSIAFSNAETYTIPKVELTPIVRIGARLWKKY